MHSYGYSRYTMKLTPYTIVIILAFSFLMLVCIAALAFPLHDYTGASRRRTTLSIALCCFPLYIAFYLGQQLYPPKAFAREVTP